MNSKEKFGVKKWLLTIDNELLNAVANDKGS